METAPHKQLVETQFVNGFRHLAVSFLIIKTAKSNYHMSKQDNQEVAIMLSKAKSHHNMIWVGLLFFPVAIIYYDMCKNQLREIDDIYDLDKDEQAVSDNIAKSAKNILITVVGLAIIANALVAFNYHNQMQQTQRAIQNAYRRYGR